MKEGKKVEKTASDMRKGLATDKIIVHKILWNISITKKKEKEEMDDADANANDDEIEEAAA